MPRLNIPLVAAILLTSGLAALAPATTGTAGGAGAAQGVIPCVGFEFVPTQGPSCPIPGGWRVHLGNGETVDTHGPDRAEFFHAMSGATAPAGGGSGAGGSGKGSAVACVADPTWQFHNVLVYALASDKPDRTAEMTPILRDMVAQANAFLRAESSALGEAARYKFRCDGTGVPTLLSVRLPTADADATFATIVRDLRAAGVGSPHAKHWVWYDGVRQGVYGEGTMWINDKLTSANRNARGNDFAITYGILDPMVMVHENAHNLGAVQLTAPHTTGWGHCTDGLDVMCYRDNPDAQYVDTVCTDRVHLDCNNDDYFHPNPPAGSWLATRWNLAHKYNRFLDFGRANTAPTLASVTCVPAVVDYDQPTTCKVIVDDDSDGVTYTVSVDGAPATRHPATGWAIAGVALTLTPSFNTLGTHTITATATDDGAGRKPLTSAPLTGTVRVGCALERLGALDPGVIGATGEAWESGIPRACGGQPFTLTGGFGSDVDLCWEGPIDQLGCFEALGDETGTIPAGATAAKIWLKAGATGNYALRAS